MKKVLIITYYWPPSGGSGVQRWLNFSRYLAELGWDITVMVPKNPSYPLIDDMISSSISPLVKVIKVPIFEPINILNLSKKRNRDHLDSSGILQKIILWLRANLFFPDSRMFWIKKVVKVASSYITQNNVDCVITTAPPFSTHLIGYHVKRKTNVKWIVDFRDPWFDFFQFKQLPMIRSIRNKHLKWERKCLVYADTVLTTSPSLTKSYLNINNNSHTITNGYESLIDSEPDAKFIIMYTGVMKSIQNPSNLWLVLNELCQENKAFSKDLLVTLIGNFDDSIITDNNIISLKSSIKFEGYIDQVKLKNKLKKAQVLLLSSVNLEGVNNIIPGKLFLYLSVKRPILAFSSLNSDVEDIINTTKSGKVFDYLNKVDLKDYILELYNQFKKRNDRLHSVGIDQYTYKSLSNKLSDIINKTI
ncbi:MAG: glycosyl transferase family 1 [Bacteroidota bacterium]|nr:glycosyl transferase family 1 [Bacteroidota bacterium]